MAEKDRWDKADIVGKIIGATLTPLMIVFATEVWRSEKEQTETNTAYRQTATEILTAPSAAVRTDPVLQTWALDVLKDPVAPPALDEDVYQKLQELTGTGAFVPLQIEPQLFTPPVQTDDFIQRLIDRYIQQQQTGPIVPLPPENQRGRIIQPQFIQPQPFPQ
ncbi:MAG: hypothetical protein ACK5IB_09060 [Qingshengfaniella sp.]